MPETKSEFELLHDLLETVLGILDRNERDSLLLSEQKELVRAAFAQHPAYDLPYPKRMYNDYMGETRVIKTPEEEAELGRDHSGTWKYAGPAK